MRIKKELAETTNSTVHNRLIRQEFKCTLCPPNRKENGNRKPKDDKHKNHRSHYEILVASFDGTIYNYDYSGLSFKKGGR